MGVRCNRNAVTLDYAAPANGYTARVEDGGPSEVQVSFTSASHVSQVTATCSGGRAQFSVKEKAA
jgi:hypothetical protein